MARKTKVKNRRIKMAGTKYTRKPSKPIKKSDRSITQTGVKKKSLLKSALKKTAKGLGKGAMAVASMSPAGRGVKAAKVAKKAAKVLRRGPGSLPKNKSAYLKGDYKYKKKLESRAVDAKTTKSANKAQKEIDLMNPNLTMDERAKLLGGF